MKEELDDLEDCHTRNRMEFRSAKCKIIYLGTINTSCDKQGAQVKMTEKESLGKLIDCRMTDYVPPM